MKKVNLLVTSVLLTSVLFGSSGSVLAAEGGQELTKNPIVFEDQLQQQPVYSMNVYLQLVVEVEQGLITTDEEAWTRLKELDTLEQQSPVLVQPLAYYDGSYYLSTSGQMAAAVFAVGPFDAAKAYSNGQTAFVYAADSGFTGPEDGKQDAYRHAFWNILMARDIGVSQAKEVADIYEEYNPGHHLANIMDYFNNSVGRNALPSSGSPTDSDLNTIIVNKVNNGDMYYIKNGILVFTDE